LGAVIVQSIRDELWARKRDLDKRQRDLAGFRRLIVECETAGRSRELTDRLSQIAKDQATAIAVDLDELAAEVRREIWRRFVARFKMTPAQRTEIGQLRHGPEIRAAWTRLTASRPRLVATTGPLSRPRTPRAKPAPRRETGKEAPPPEPEPDPEHLGRFALARLARSRAWTELFNDGDREEIAAACAWRWEVQPEFIAAMQNVITAAALRNLIEPPPRVSLWLTRDIPPGFFIYRDNLGMWRIIEATPAMFEQTPTKGSA
jgi:hypothetical protein